MSPEQADALSWFEHPRYPQLPGACVDPAGHGGVDPKFDPQSLSFRLSRARDAPLIPRRRGSASQPLEIFTDTDKRNVGLRHTSLLS
jgi:hypothetical protein